MPDGFLGGLVPWATAGLGAGGGFMLIKWIVEFIAGRWDKKEAAIDAGTQRLIDRLEKQVNRLTERLDRVESDLADCKRMHSESEAERLRLAALLQGSGDARQLAQLVIAAEKAGGSNGAQVDL